MGRLTYAMNLSLDGYICDADGRFDWSVPTPELHDAHNAIAAASAGEFMGRKLYELMTAWDDPAFGAGDPVQERFGATWRGLDKVVFSRTLTEVADGYRLAEGTIAEELSRIDGDVGIGGATLAASVLADDLIDEFHVFTFPVLVGGGTPFFGPFADRRALRLVGTGGFGEVTHAHYERVR